MLSAGRSAAGTSWRLAARLDEVTFHHVTVLGSEAVGLLAPLDGGIYVDCTLGGGGHSELLLRAADCRVIGIDRDPGALRAAGERLAPFGSAFTAVRGSFGAIRQHLDTLGIERVDGLVADLGVSSPQLDVADRGFSFQKAGPLDMRMGPDLPETAAELIDRVTEEELADIIWRYGDERQSRRIARQIVAERPFRDTLHLAEVVAGARGGPWKRAHPATKTFQALRIAVNHEFEELSALLATLPQVLVEQGRVAIISFMSLDDRLVKSTFRELAGVGTPRDAYGQPVTPPVARLLTRKPITATDGNPRARSARLRGLALDRSAT